MSLIPKWRLSLIQLWHEVRYVPDLLARTELTFSIQLTLCYFQQKLTEIRQWSDKVSNFDRCFVSENGMFYIDCSVIHNVLLPRLDDIYQELIAFVSEEGKTLARLFCSDMQTVLHNLKKKHASVEAFASYAKHYYQYKKNMPSYQQRIEYIKSLFEVRLEFILLLNISRFSLR